MTKINPEVGMTGVRLYIEDKYGEYRMNGDVDRNLKLQLDHESLSIEVIMELAEVKREVAKSIYSMAYYYGHAQGIEEVDKYIDIAIQAVKISKI